MIAGFLYLEKKEVRGFHGRRTIRETMISPRLHWWEVVNRLIETTRAEGPGKRCLVQHSAGYISLERHAREDATVADSFATDGPLVIDVRTPMEFSMGAYPGALNISLN